MDILLKLSYIIYVLSKLKKNILPLLLKSFQHLQKKSCSIQPCEMFWPKSKCNSDNSSL